MSLINLLFTITLQSSYKLRKICLFRFFHKLWNIYYLLIIKDIKAFYHIYSRHKPWRPYLKSRDSSPVPRRLYDRR